MSYSNFSEETLKGLNKEYKDLVQAIHEKYGLDFTALGLTAFHGSPLKWIYSAGATGERYKRISLAPGHGIGGIVLKAGKPMFYTNIDEEMDPRDYSSYPIVFAEDLRSFLALPLTKLGRVVGVLLCSFRTASEAHKAVYRQLSKSLEAGFCDMGVITADVLDFGTLDRVNPTSSDDGAVNKSLTSRLINAQEEERRRISRVLHDGIAQELLAVRFQLQKLLLQRSFDEAEAAIEEAQQSLDTVLNELHNVSVELRPSTLDHFGLLSALKSQAQVYREMYGVVVEFDISQGIERMEPSYETQVYRICQEALLNSCKYSGVDKVRASAREAGGWLEIQISDEGCGFNTEAPVIRGGGCGLHGMRERASLIGAKLEIESSENGTTVTLIAPTGR